MAIPNTHNTPAAHESNGGAVGVSVGLWPAPIRQHPVRQRPVCLQPVRPPVAPDRKRPDTQQPAHILESPTP
jgi:hypothetical protein